MRVGVRRGDLRDRSPLFARKRVGAAEQVDLARFLDGFGGDDLFGAGARRRGPLRQRDRLDPATSTARSRRGCVGRGCVTGGRQVTLDVARLRLVPTFEADIARARLAGVTLRVARGRDGRLDLQQLWTAAGETDSETRTSSLVLHPSPSASAQPRGCHSSRM